MIRRRTGSSSSVHEQMEKGAAKNQHSRVCILVALSFCLWILLFYFHFVVLGAPKVDETYHINPSSHSYEMVDERMINFRTSSSEPKPSLRTPSNGLPRNTQMTDNNLSTKALPIPKRSPIDAELPPISRQKNAQKAPNDHPNHAQLPPISHQSNTRMTPNDHPNHAQLPPIRRQSNAKIMPKDHPNNAQLPPISHQNDALPTPDIPTSNTRNKVMPVIQSNNQLNAEKFPFMRALRTAENKSDPCGGRYIYVHDLPPRFNEDMLKECRSLSRWTNMCKFTTYAGLGPPLENVEGVFSDEGWYATNQFAVDVIFSNRMKQYECLTNDSSLAAAIFVPFYAGFDVARYLWGYNISMRDAASLDLIDWLSKRPEWRIMGGKDHFLVAGRITWDFRRLSESDSDWGNKLLFLPAGKNMSMLVVESSPWNANDFAIPYPTYFHPEKDADVFLWQDRMRKLERKWLFSFAGAPRPGNPKSIRGQLIDQCRSSEKGKLLECDLGESTKCHSPSNIMKMFQSSVFCLQPQGDSYTRRSAFDSMLAGCIPVFFHPGSAYTQYIWHLPKNYSKYSVFVPEEDIRKKNASLEQRLSQISDYEVKMMREEVINLIPRLIYADPRSKLETLKDAFDVSVEAIIDKVTGHRRDIIDGRTDDDFIEEVSWRYDLVGREKYMEPHEWDPFFSKPKGGNEESSESAEVAKNSWKSEQRAHS